MFRAIRRKKRFLVLYILWLVLLPPLIFLALIEMFFMGTVLTNIGFLMIIVSTAVWIVGFPIVNRRFQILLSFASFLLIVIGFQIPTEFQRFVSALSFPSAIEVSKEVSDPDGFHLIAHDIPNLEYSLTTEADMKMVADFYRKILEERHWKIQKDTPCHTYGECLSFTRGRWSTLNIGIEKNVIGKTEIGIEIYEYTPE